MTRFRQMGGRAATLLALAALLATGGCDRAGRVIDPSAEMVIHGATLWDGTGAPPIPNAIVQIGGGRILSVNPVDADSDPAALRAAWIERRGPGAADRFIVAADGFIVPGLINAHGHVGATWVPESGIGYRDFVLAELRRYARFGITTVNSLGGEHPSAFAIRDRSWTDSPGHARLLVSGPIQTPATAEQAALEIDRLAPLHPDWVKIRVDDNRVPPPRCPRRSTMP